MTTRIPRGGTVLLSRDAPRDIWLKARRHHLCASDVPKALGKSNWGDAYSVWCDKRGFITDDDPTEAQLFGQIMEPSLLQLWKRTSPDAEHVTGIRRSGLIQSNRWPIAAATVDRLARCPLGRCVVEAKTDNGADPAKRWGTELNPTVSVPYIYQGQWQLLVTGRDHVHYPVLVGRRVWSRIVHRDQALIDWMLDWGQGWWQRHIVEDEMPEATSRSRELLAERWPAPVTTEWIMDDVDVELYNDARLYRAAADSAELRASTAEATFMSRMGAATHARYSNGELAATWIPSRRIDGATAKWAIAHRELWEKYSREEITRKFDPAAVRADYRDGDLPPGLRYRRPLELNPSPEVEDHGTTD